MVDMVGIHIHQPLSRWFQMKETLQHSRFSLGDVLQQEQRGPAESELTCGSFVVSVLHKPH